METVAIPWGALIALGSAVSAVVVALWAKIRAIERQRDEWTNRWAREVRRNAGDMTFEENTDVRTLRDRILSDYLSDSTPPGRHKR